MSWNAIHTHYNKQDWSKIPSIFAEQVVSYFQKPCKILEIGAGLGQDSRFFCDSDFDVVSTDFSVDVVQMNQERSQKQIQSGKYEIDILDISKGIPFADGEFDVVYAHLSLHYFSETKTQEIATHILDVLKQGGILAILLNTKDDPEYGTGEKIEDDFYMFSGISKRYFDIESARKLFGEGFDIQLLDNQGETYKDRAKGIHNMIRFVGKKV